MIIGRKAECRRLETQYRQSGGSLVVLYGRKGTGKTSLIRWFAKDKPLLYYQSAECSACLQMNLLAQAWNTGGKTDWTGRPEELADILNRAVRLLRNREQQTDLSALQDDGKKPVIVLEDFSRIGRGLCEVYSVLAEFVKVHDVLVILTEDTIIWEEEEKKIPEDFLTQICDRIYLKPFGFLEMAKYFPTLPTEEVIRIYATLGGIPGYLKYWDIEKSYRENVTELLLSPEGRLHNEVTAYLHSGLRELGVYNTVLSSMTKGCVRLNDIFSATGFSRAKISVYLKNLKQLGVIEKAESISLSCHDQPLKGIYRISDPLVHFWYRFAFAYASALEQGRGAEVYEKYILSGMEDHIGVYFEQVCFQYLEIMNQMQRLPFCYTAAGPWFGQSGTLQRIALDEHGRQLLMQCKWDDSSFSTKDLEKLLQYLMLSGIQPEYYFLFSKNGFDAELCRKAEYVKNMFLIDLKDL